MNMMKYGVMMARRGWSQQRDIINTMRYEDLIKWINS